MIKRMRVLYNSPDEKIRLWISWLIKLAEDGKKWYTWLDSHMKILQQILNLVTGEYFTNSDVGNAENIQRKNELVEKAVDEIVPDGDEVKSPQLRGEINRTQDVIENELSPPTKATAAVGEILNVNKSRQWMDEEHSGEVLESSVAFDKIPWPIGVPWVPQVFDRKRKKQTKLRKLEFVKDKILLPENKERMIKFMDRMKHQATIYQSLYKHWQGIINRVQKEVISEQIMSRENHFTHVEIPHFFYLYSPLDIDITNEYDDEAAMTREIMNVENS